MIITYQVTGSRVILYIRIYVNIKKKKNNNFRVFFLLQINYGPNYTHTHTR